MEVLEYTRMIDKFGRKLENAIAKDFPRDADLAATVNAALSKLTLAVISSFVLPADNTTDDKEKK